MSTVDKALSLLDHFGGTTPELGLRSLAQLSGFDKATTHRLLNALAGRGFVDQDGTTKKYRLGPALIRFAQLREVSFPLVTAARPAVDALSTETGETVHVSELVSGHLSAAYVAESSKVIRVSVAVGQKLPFSGTASGMAVLAFGSDALRKAVASTKLVAYTSHSVTSHTALNKQLREIHERGFAIGDRGFEDGVFSVAAPLLNSEGLSFGAISIATPSPRMGRDTIKAHSAGVCQAASRISAALGFHPARA
jgi:DNA-binding IclR family transcriptional regulator